MQTESKIRHSILYYIHYFLFSILLLSFITPVRSAMAGAKEFIPRYRDYSGELVLRGMTAGRNTKNNGRSSTYQNINFQEFFHANGAGFVYHPSFISLLSSISIGLQQENRDTNSSTYSKYGTMFGFRQEIIVLPNHPYNLRLYAGRADEMVRGQAGVSSRVTSYDWGAQASYIERPWQAILNYTHFETVSTWDSVTDTVGANLYYFDTLTLWNINGSYNHYNSSRYNDQSRTVIDVYDAHISKDWESFRFLSRWNLDKNRQEDRYYSLSLPDYNETRERREWFSEVVADLPYNVTSRFSYRNRNSEAEFQRGTRTGGAVSETNNYNLNFTHHLYKSLITNLNSGYRTTESYSGKSENKNIRLSTNYSKIIRWGSVGASLSTGVSDTANEGATTTLSEKHSLTPSSPTSFTLNNTELDPATIRVSVIDSFNNNRVVPLIADVHYTVLRVGESYRILILSLPPSLPEPWPDYIYLADYANISSEYAIRGTNFGAGLSMSLFDQLLMSRVGYQRSDAQMIDGDFPGVLDNSVSYNAGLSSNYRNLRADISKHWRKSSIENTERLNVYLTGSLKTSALTGGSLTLSYENRNTEQIVASGSTRELTLEEDIYAGHIQAYTAWPKWNLDATFGLSYSLYYGLGESSAGSINSALNWSIGRMDLNMRLSYHTSESQIQSSESSSNYYTAWLTLRRKIF